MMLMYYKKMDMGFLWINYTSHRRGVVLSNTALHTAYITWQLFYFMSRGKRHVYALFLMSFVEIVTFESFKLYDVALKFMNFEYDNCCVTFQLHDTVWKTTVDTNLTSFIFLLQLPHVSLSSLYTHTNTHSFLLIVFHGVQESWVWSSQCLKLSSPPTVCNQHTQIRVRVHTHIHTQTPGFMGWKAQSMSLALPRALMLHLCKAKLFGPLCARAVEPEAVCVCVCVCVYFLCVHACYDGLHVCEYLPWVCWSDLSVLSCMLRCACMCVLLSI